MLNLHMRGMHRLLELSISSCTYVFISNGFDDVTTSLVIVDGVDGCWSICSTLCWLVRLGAGGVPCILARVASLRLVMA